jgi:hypothetical protein
MRKLMVGLMVVGLLAIGAPATAQQGDPLGLISSGAVIPYVGDGTIAPGSVSLLELASPVGQNPSLHMVFFDQSCVRKGQSIPNPLTTNDLDLVPVSGLPGLNGIGGAAPDGLIAIASASSGFARPSFTETLEAPIHTRLLWLNAIHNYIRTIEPIALANSDINNVPFNSFVWNPLRTAATFWAPQVQPGLNTTIYLVCPNQNITGRSSSILPGFLEGGVFPELIPQPAASTSVIDALIFDTEENPLRDTRISCSCLTAIPLGDAVLAGSEVYTLTSTFTKLQGDFTPKTSAVCSNDPADPQTCPGDPNKDCFDASTQCNLKVITPSIPGTGPAAFTGYRAITLGTENFDVVDNFGRLSNAANCSIFSGVNCVTNLR